MRNLAAIDAVEEVGTEEYKASKVSRAFAQPKGSCGAKFLFVSSVFLSAAECSTDPTIKHPASTFSIQCG